MAEYIDRQTVLRCIKESRENIDWGQSEDGDAFLHYSAALYRTIASKECLPSADVEPVRHGRWITETLTDACGCKHAYYVCSVCETSQNWDEFDYCPNCGARMDSEQTVQAR